MNKTIIISSCQIKAARALLDWSQDNLAEKSGLSIATIRKIEAGNASPRGKTNEQLRQAFEESGLDFLERDGLQRKKQDIIFYRGENSAKDFFDDVYSTVSKNGGHISVVCSNSNTFLSKALKEHITPHLNRMAEIKNMINARCIFTKKSDYIPAAAYMEYRHLSENLIDSVPFYIYNDKCGIRLSDSDTSPHIMVIQSKELADTYNKQFKSMWDKATLLSKPK